MNYDLVRPCPKCPFRTDVPAYLRRDRCVEIARSIAEGSPFPCHQTTVPDGDDLVATGPSQFCAGALIVMENEEMPNQQMRIAERIGLYDPTKLDRSAPVHSSMVAFIDHHGADEEDDYECCSVCDSGCEAPAGYLVNGVAVRSDEHGEVHNCEDCGEFVCDNCAADEGLCPSCAEYAQKMA